jgi:hypothetical protein
VGGNASALLWDSMASSSPLMDVEFEGFRIKLYQPGVVVIYVHEHCLD